MAAAPSYDLEAWRARVPLLRRAIPMNHCSQAPLMRPTRLAAEAFLDDWDSKGMDWPGWLDKVESARSGFAGLIGADPDEVAVTTSVSAASASLASALDFGSSRNVIVSTEGEFPTVSHVWSAHRRYGARVRLVPLRHGAVPIDGYPPRVGPDTLLVSATHGYYRTGATQDLARVAEIAHEAGALVFVDAYQTLGTEPLDVKALDVDFLASGCLKFLLGTAGIAFLYVKRELLHRLEPAATGWFGRKDPFAFDATLDWAASARRFDTGTPPVLPACIADAGMAVLREVGTEAVASWTIELRRHLRGEARRHGLELLGPENEDAQGPTTAVACNDAQRVESRLRERGVLASARGAALRFAPHFYTTLDDVDRALEALSDVLRR